MWIITKLLWGTGNKYITEIGLCVSKGLIVMYEIDYGITVAEKHIYWTPVIYGDQINALF